jgi:UDP-glucose 4-epimerase
MSVVAVTGCSGYIGTQLLNFLKKDDTVSQVLGVDIKPPMLSMEKLDFQLMDVRDPKLKDLFTEGGVERVVHLAFIVNPMHDVDEMHDIDVNGTRNALDATAACGARHLTAASSTTAFGASPDNPEWFAEDDPPHKHASYPYASDKYDIEEVIRTFKEDHPDIKVAVIRPCMVFGPNVENYLSRFFMRMPIIPGVGKARPQMQFVHEDDVAEIFMKVVEQEAEGYFHAVGEGTLGLDEIARMAGKPIIGVPDKILYPSIDLLWKLHFPLIEGSSGALDYMRYPWNASDEKTREVLGLGPRRSSEEVFRLMLESHGKRAR